MKSSSDPLWGSGNPECPTQNPYESRSDDTNDIALPLHEEKDG